MDMEFWVLNKDGEKISLEELEKMAEKFDFSKISGLEGDPIWVLGANGVTGYLMYNREKLSLNIYDCGENSKRDFEEVYQFKLIGDFYGR